MKIIHVSFLVLFFFTNAGFSYGQSVKENELVVIQGEKFILHQVRTGETIYSISRDFRVDSPRLLKYNPTISEGLSIGEILKIPFNENVDSSNFPKYKKGDPTGFLNHTIESNDETVYSISKKYGITVEEVYAYNPTVQKLKKGVTLKIPQWEFEAKTAKAEETTSKTQISKQDNLIEHSVVSGETLFSIGQKYKLSESEILQYNPEAKNLKAGTKLYLPQKGGESNAEIQINQSEKAAAKYINHTVESGETMYGITKKYNVSEKDLFAVNPELKNGLRAGTIIQIPVFGSESDPLENQESNKTNQQTQEVFTELGSSAKVPGDCQPNAKTGGVETTTVALFLPLFLEANEKLNKELGTPKIDTLEQLEIDDNVAVDTIIEEEKPVHLFKQFYGNSENFLQFYEGVLMAVDSMQKAGMKVVLNVFDTKDNPSSIRKVIDDESFLATDLIIGPVYENVQKEVAQIAEANNIPIVSPFTPKSTIIGSNPQFYQINPTREYLTEATAQMVAKYYSNTNFIVVKTSSYEGTPDGQLVDLISKKLAVSGNSNGGKFTVYDFRKERANGLKNLLLPEKENVVFIPSSDEGELSVAISNINNLARDFPITLIGSGNYQQKYPSIEVTHYHNLQFKYINPYWIDYKNGSTINFIEKFISNFATEPNSYGVQGFDVAWYFLNAIHFYGKDFENCLPFMNTKLLQGNYYFKRVSSSGGFMNEGVSVISYKRNFEVERMGIIGKTNLQTP